MKRNIPVFLFSMIMICLLLPLNAARKEITASELPPDVLDVLNRYCSILSTSPDLETCAKRLAAISGGHLVNAQGTISRDVFEFSLKKDFQNIRFYRVPPVITRIVMETDSYDGYGPTMIEGTRYKIWIAKKEGAPGLPAPIPVIKPVKGEPKVVSNIGSL